MKYLSEEVDDFLIENLSASIKSTIMRILISQGDIGHLAVIRMARACGGECLTVLAIEAFCEREMAKLKGQS